MSLLGFEIELLGLVAAVITVSRKTHHLDIKTKANLGTMKRLRGRGGFTVLLPYNTCTGLIFPKKEAAAL